jgi:glycosyltransferase involved in cell wall biosynthesis
LKNNIKHILIIPSWYKTLENPVLGSFFEEQARGLMRLGYKVGILHLGFKPFMYNRNLLDRCFNDEGLFTIQKEFRASIPKLHKINYWLFGKKVNNILKEYIDANGIPDVIHAHSVFYGGIAAMYISEKTKIPYIITEHLTHFITGKVTASADISISRTVFVKSKESIVVSKEFRSELSQILNLPDESFKVIHNMVSPIFFENNFTAVINPNKGVRFFTNSFLTTRKNHKLMINAFKIFHEKFPNSQLVIGGDATNENDMNYKNTLVQFSDDLGLKDSVLFLGALSRIEVKKQLDQCHVFLLASTYETFGVVLIEALACGRPVVSTDSKGPRDIINSTNGILVTDFEEHRFAESMISMIRNYYTYDQEKISVDCKKCFSEEVIIEKILKLYESYIY